MENASGIGQEILNYSAHTCLKPKYLTRNKLRVTIKEDLNDDLEISRCLK
jgi:hypothetical protein